ncbi:MAG: GNAT family N-acetyltransferase, partial [Rhodobacteraceae bacterium]|nr:GNAT family N-acetyltransferase [Paracoccaceae bacterium]
TCVKMIREDVAEIKRLYVRPAGRGQGLGRALAERAMEAARTLGAKRMFLDSLKGMTAARGLYADLGFAEIAAYPETQNPPLIHPFTVFMARDFQRPGT